MAAVGLVPLEHLENVQAQSLPSILRRLLQDSGGFVPNERKVVVREVVVREVAV